MILFHVNLFGAQISNPSFTSHNQIFWLLKVLMQMSSQENLISNEPESNSIQNPRCTRSQPLLQVYSALPFGDVEWRYMLTREFPPPQEFFFEKMVL